MEGTVGELVLAGKEGQAEASLQAQLQDAAPYHKGRSTCWAPGRVTRT